MCQNAFEAGAPPRTPLAVLIALPSKLDLTGLEGRSEEERGEEKEGDRG